MSIEAANALLSDGYEIQRITIDLVASGSIGHFGGTGTTTVRRALRTSVDLRTR